MNNKLPIFMKNKTVDLYIFIFFLMTFLGISYKIANIPLLYCALILIILCSIFCDSQVELMLIYSITPFLVIAKFSENMFSIAVLMIIIFIVKRIIIKEKIQFDLIVILTILSGLQIIDMLWADASINNIFGFLLNMIFIIHATIYMKETNLGYRLEISYIIGLLSSACVLLFFDYNHLFKMITSNEYIYRYQGFANDPNFLGQQALIGIAFVLTLFLNKKLSIFLTVFLTTLFTAIGVSTMSKTFFAVLTILFVLMAIYYVPNKLNNRSKSTKIYTYCILIFCVIIISYIFIRILFPILETRLVKSDNIFSQRDVIAIRYMNMLYNDIPAMILGIGFNNSYHYSSIFKAFNYVPHNMYISSMYEMGIVGLVLFISIIAKSVGFNIRSLKSSRSLFFVVLLLTGISLSIGSYDTFFILTPLLVYSHKQQRDNC